MIFFPYSHAGNGAPPGVRRKVGQYFESLREEHKGVAGLGGSSGQHVSFQGINVASMVKFVGVRGGADKGGHVSLLTCELCSP